MELDTPNIKQDLNELEYWIVGGAVRDVMLDKKPKDRDYVVIGATADEMKNRGFQPIKASNFPVFQDSNGDEWALARKETKKGEGYHGFETFTDDVTLREDLQRRDFTINAIAYNPEKDVYDYPVAVKNNIEAHSIRDLKQGILRHITDSFEEDPVRILRLARFAGRLPNFEIDDDTMQYAQENSYKLDLANNNSTIPAERINQEITKALKEAENPVRFMEVMKQTGALNYILPELQEYEDISAGPHKHHAEGDLWTHTMMVLEEMHKIDANNPDKLLMALVHDIGKIKTQNQENSGGHDKKGIPIIEEICGRLKLSNSKTEKMKDASRHHMRTFNVDPYSPDSMKAGKVIKLVEQMRTGKGATQEELLHLMEADHKGRKTTYKTSTKPVKRIKKRLKTAEQTIEKIGAEYSVKKRGKTLEDYDGETIGQIIQMDRVEHMKEREKSVTGKLKDKILQAI